MTKRPKYVTKTFLFPEDEMKAYRFFGCPETIEHLFGIEISCGDGKFLSKIPYDSPDLEKYDGVCDIGAVRWGDQIHIGPFGLSIQYCEDMSYGPCEEFKNPKVSFKKVR